MMRTDKAALQTLVQTLAQASASAEAGVAGLKAAAEETGRELERKLQAAQALREDLAYMIDRGGAIADRMEASLRPRREPPPAETARPRPTEVPRPRPVEALRPSAEAPSREPRTGGVNFIQEMAARLAPAAAAAGTPSRAERDLLRALAGRR
ncbi:MAG TPA: DUF6468 domain-containing protein [Stellaceae bacterium]|nr:DUF6468 domain-containing protein [Stellaceae bacterium]